MIIHEAVVELMNAQLVSEFSASQQYVAIAIYFEMEGLSQLAGFFYRQAEEERMHAMKFVQFMLDTGAHPIMPTLDNFRNSFDGAEDAIDYALQQELRVTAEINTLMACANKNHDYTSAQFLQWFVNEQVEEVSSMSELLQTVQHAGGMLLFVEEHVRRLPQAAESQTA